MNRPLAAVCTAAIRAFALALPVWLTVVRSFAADAKTGLLQDHPIDGKLFPSAKEYFQESIPKKVYMAYRDKKSPASWNDNATPPEECVSLAPGSSSCVVYVPSDYDGTRAFGIYLHISPGARGHVPSQEWRRLMDAMSLIYVSAHDTANETPLWRRVALSMDSLATIRKQYDVDAKRIVVGGLSGGGHMAFFCQMLYPECFQGAVSHAAQAYLPKGKGHFGHYPGLGPNDVRSGLRKERKWIVISGDKDKNYEAIKTTSVDWEKAGMAYRFIDVPGMAHENAPVSAFEDALTWILGKPPAAQQTPAESITSGSKEPLGALRTERRTWTATNGKTLEASFVRMDGLTVVLRPDDGQLRFVPVSALSAADQALLRTAPKGP